MGNKSILYKKTLGCLVGGLVGDAMGGPTEDHTYTEIEEKFGEVTDFSGGGTDDTLVKMILCDAIITSGGYVTADEFAQAFLRVGKENNRFYGHGILHNMFSKLMKNLVLPAYAGQGNSQTSHSCMMISPMGIINACNPRQAAMECYEVAGLIHADVAHTARDAACAAGAAVAEAMKADATVESIIEASCAYLHPVSAAHMIERIQTAVSAARRIGDYKKLRAWYYENNLSGASNDPDETVPCALAFLWLAQGDPEKAVVYAANFGRDADTIATIAGSIAGALVGIDAFPGKWLDKMADAMPEQEALAENLARIACDKVSEQQKRIDQFLEIS
ncbi:MAG: ADP-ribosylglycohydrolase family protein [Oscillospiraceae bacterium]|jgi:ADP-ribosylglycohydrolase|nr:ADP-ribosylglycohydrolase family protein [Oscillospiraceae bacterium]